jgi:16S rRNA (cytosine967-C5)-methyltransferase
MQFSSLIGHTREVLGIIQHSDKPADSLLDTFFRSRRYLGSHDRKFIAETTYGVLRHRLRCELLLEEAVEAVPDAVQPDDRLLWTVFTYLLSVDNQSDRSSAVLDLVAKGGQHQGQVAAVIERIRQDTLADPGNPVEKIAREYSYQRWMVEQLFEEYGPEETEALCRSLNEPAPLTLRANTLKATVEECQSRLKSEGIETTRARLAASGLIAAKRTNLFKLPSFHDGLFEVQDEGSQLVPVLIDPKPTDKVLDACAGAGGKTLQLAALMKNRGEIVATDISAFRLRELRKRANRAGAFNIRVKSPEELGEQFDSLRGSFDIVFADVPCSGSGTIRRNPGMKWTVSQKDLGELSAKQLEILQSNAPFVKPGGMLVYATCTLFRQENEDVINRFLSGTKEFKPMNPERFGQKTGIPDCVRNGHFVISPHVHGTDGFFCAVLERTSENPD